MIFSNETQHSAEAERLLACFAAKGMRLTGSRRAIIDCLEASQDWLTPAAIHEQAQRLRPSIGLVTVYRTLNWLHEQGLVRRIHLPDGCHGYALANLPHGHYLVCRECQQVVEFSNCDLTAMEEQVMNDTGFSIQGHMLQFVGVCPSCRRHASG
jgi:Fur family ferric uptake transcriptional regulator